LSAGVEKIFGVGKNREGLNWYRFLERWKGQQKDTGNGHRKRTWNSAFRNGGCIRHHNTDRQSEQPSPEHHPPPRRALTCLRLPRKADTTQQKKFILQRLLTPHVESVAISA
jgi:hypothetical protein